MHKLSVGQGHSASFSTRSLVPRDRQTFHGTASIECTRSGRTRVPVLLPRPSLAFRHTALPYHGQRRALGATFRRVSFSRIFALVGQLTSGCAVRSVAAPDCSAGWHRNIDLRSSSGAPGYVESPVILKNAGAFVLLGTPAFYWAERSAFDPPPIPGVLTQADYLARLRRNHGFVGFYVNPSGETTPLRPPGVQVMRRISAAGGTDGVIHAVWYSSRNDSIDSDDDRMVWYAELKDGQWSPPKSLFRADQLDWSGASASVLLGDSGDIHIVFSFARSSQTGIAYIRRLKGYWKVSETNVAGLPSEASAQLLPGDSILVAFARVGAPGARVRNGQHVFVIRAATRDSVWPIATRVQWSRLDGVKQLKVYLHHDSDSISLVWGRVSSETGSIRSVSSIVSTDLGRTWQPEKSSTLGLGATTLAQDQASSGEIHVIFAGFTGSRERSSKMYHTILRGDIWSSPELVTGVRAASSFSLSSVGGRRLLLVWSEVRPAGGPQGDVPVPITRFTSFTGGCSG